MNPKRPNPGSLPDTTVRRSSRLRSRAALSGLVACAAITAGVAAADENGGFAALKALKIDAATIKVLEHEAAPVFTTTDGKETKLPPRVLLKMMLNPAKGSNINVEMWLPDADKWNGCLLGLGNGGPAGSIHSAGLISPLEKGYAVVTTDMGTSPNPDSGVGNPEVWKDFGFRATHLMTVAAKQVVKTYYGRAQEFAYFAGGSTGGQQGLQEAQRYPGDYDGIVSTISAHCRTPLHAYFLWNDQIFKKCPFTHEQQAAIIAAGNEYMASRETPPTAGKMVSDPRCDSKDIEAVIALAMKKDATLTKEHAEALRKLFDGPRHAITGERIFNGIPFGAPFDIAHGNLYLFKWVFGAAKDTNDIDFGKDIDTYTATLGPYLTANNPDLREFEKRGGKLIMTEGSADSCVPYHSAIDYYEQVAVRMGSLEKAESFFKFYIIPGLSHGPGPGINHLPDLLSLVRDWREKGTAPDRLDAKRVIDGKTELEMPLYPYPAKTGWDAQAGTFQRVDGPRGGVDPIAARFLPPAAE